MVDGFTKDGKFRPISRSPIAPPQSLTVRELLPKGELTQQEKTAEKDRRNKFALERKEESKKKEEVSKKKKLFLGSVKGVKKIAGLTRLGAEKIQSARIERSIRDFEFSQRLDRQIDEILDDPNSSDPRKFRLLVRLATINRRDLTKDQARFIDRTNRELAFRINEERKATPTIVSSTGGGVGSGISSEAFAKLPQVIKEEARESVE